MRVLGTLGLAALALAAAHDVNTGLPNILVIVVDDLGYGDLGCYGNTTIRSPNIDALASNGIRFTQFYSPAPICTPSRAGILTGRYPVRTGMTSTRESFRTLNSPAQPGGLPATETTFAKALKRVGYRTGMVGKWHLGIGANYEHLPTSHGFDSFFGMPVTNVQSCPVCASDVGAPHGSAPAATGCKGGKRIYDVVGGHGKLVPRPFLTFFFATTGHVWYTLAAGLATAFLVLNPRHRRRLLVVAALALVAMCAAMWYTVTFTLLAEPSCLLMANETIVEQPLLLQNLTERNTLQATQFIERAQHERQHGDGRPWLMYLAYVKVHTALFTAPQRTGLSAHGAYGDNLEELDWSVGEVVRALRETGAQHNTLVVFTSDNGPFLERGVEAGYCGAAPDSHGVLQGPLRGAKGQTWECGVRVPAILSWPRASGPVAREHRAVASGLDIYPTIMQAVQVGSAADGAHAHARTCEHLPQADPHVQAQLDDAELGARAMCLELAARDGQAPSESEGVRADHADSAAPESHPPAAPGPLSQSEAAASALHSPVSPRLHVDTDLPVDGVSMLPLLFAHDEGRVHAAAASMHQQRPMLFHYCGSTVTAVRWGRYKAHFATPVWDAGLSACPSRNICPCLGQMHDPPLVFDVEDDPSESHPLNASHPLVADVVLQVANARNEHVAAVGHVPSQLNAPGNPLLYPCCNPGGRLSRLELAWRVATGTCTCDA